MRLSEQLLEKYWPLTDVSLQSVLQASGERVVSVIAAREGRFVAKISDQWHSTEESETHASIFDFLQEAGFGHVPAILKTRTGCNYQKIGDHPVYILDFIAGKEPQRTRENYRRLGEITGELHAIVGYPHKYLFTVADVIPELYEIAGTLSFAQDYARIVKRLPSFQDLPVALIHGEILGNCIQDPAGQMVIVDWDEAGSGTRVLDLGQPLLQVFLSEDLEWDQVGAGEFYEGYFSHIALDDREISRIFDAGLFYALRYIIYGNTEKRWERIQFAVRNRDLLAAVVRDAALGSSPGDHPEIAGQER
jgi:Ser/Thr protein kinase RdoA (MazF antagonist)